MKFGWGGICLTLPESQTQKNITNSVGSKSFLYFLKVNSEKKKKRKLFPLNF